MRFMNIMLSKRNKTEKNTYCFFTYIDTNIYVYKIQEQKKLFHDNRKAN